MSKICVVTDGCASFSTPEMLKGQSIHVVPVTITADEYAFQIKGGVPSSETLITLGNPAFTPEVVIPSVDDYIRVYGQLAESMDVILSIHVSRELYPSWDHARLAAQQVSSSCQVIVIDSGTIGVAQGLLVEYAARISRQYDNIDQIVTAIRDATKRVYSLYSSKSTSHLQRAGILSESHSILGELLDVHTLLSMESGKVAVVEKAKTRTRAIEKLVEFYLEFVGLEQMLIVHNPSGSDAFLRALQNRLQQEQPGQHFSTVSYSEVMASLIGDAIGIVVFENE